MNRNFREALNSRTDLLTSPTWVDIVNRCKKVGYVRWVTTKLRDTFMFNVVFGRDRIRYLRYLGVRVGSNCSIYNSIQDFGSEPWLIELGDRVTLTRGVVLVTHDGSSRVFRDLIPDTSPFGNRYGCIRVLNNCFIGVNSIILPDVQIGPHSIVGAGSVVNHNVPPYSVFAGVPARQICTLEEYVQKYQDKMLSIRASDRHCLRIELTQKLWGETR